MPILKIMESMGVQVDPKSMAYAQTYNDYRIMTAETETSDASKLVRSTRRAEKLAENNVFEETECLLYAPGIADQCKYKFLIRNLKLKLETRFSRNNIFLSGASDLKNSIKPIAVIVEYVILYKDSSGWN